jgi:hypothetical protein
MGLGKAGDPCDPCCGGPKLCVQVAGCRHGLEGRAVEVRRSDDSVFASGTTGPGGLICWDYTDPDTYTATSDALARYLPGTGSTHGDGVHDCYILVPLDPDPDYVCACCADPMARAITTTINGTPVALEYTGSAPTVGIYGNWSGCMPVTLIPYDFAHLVGGGDLSYSGCVPSPDPVDTVADVNFVCGPGVGGWLLELMYEECPPRSDCDVPFVGTPKRLVASGPLDDAGCGPPLHVAGTFSETNPRFPGYGALYALGWCSWWDGTGSPPTVAVSVDE